MSATTPRFNIGDSVMSGPDTDDVTVMKAVWHARIHKLIGPIEDGDFCYETVGRWEGLGSGHAYDLTLRQLWDSYLIEDTTPLAVAPA